MGLKNVLWTSLGVGLIIDLFSSSPLFGAHAFAYTLTTLLLYSQKKHFFPDSLSTIPILTYFFSLLSSTLLLMSTLLMVSLPLTFSSFATDFVIFPFLDALYAFLVFTLLPFNPKKTKREYFLNHGK